MPQPAFLVLDLQTVGDESGGLVPCEIAAILTTADRAVPLWEWRRYIAVPTGGHPCPDEPNLPLNQVDRFLSSSVVEFGGSGLIDVYGNGLKRELSAWPSWLPLTFMETGQVHDTANGRPTFGVAQIDARRTLQRVQQALAVDAAS